MERDKSGLQAVDWAVELDSISPTEMISLILQKCSALAQQFAPQRRRAKKGSHIPRHRRILMRKRTKLRKQYRAQHNEARKEHLRAKLSIIECKLQDSYRSQESNEEAKAIDKIKSNSKYFFSYAKRRSKTRTPVGPLKDQWGNMISTPTEMANILSDQYESAFSNPVSIALNTSTIPVPNLDDIVFTEEAQESY